MKRSGAYSNTSFRPAKKLSAVMVPVDTKCSRDLAILANCFDDL